jgi:hypothetical protein
MMIETSDDIAGGAVALTVTENQTPLSFDEIIHGIRAASAESILDRLDKTQSFLTARTLQTNIDAAKRKREKLFFVCWPDGVSCFVVDSIRAGNRLSIPDEILVFEMYQQAAKPENRGKLMQINRPVRRRRTA